MTVNLSSSNKQIDTILVLDFGSQYTQLIARRVRELGVFSEISNHKQVKKVNVEELFGIILSGGPLNVYEINKYSFDKKFTPSFVISFPIPRPLEFISVTILPSEEPSYLMPGLKALRYPIRSLSLYASKWNAS